MQQPPDPNQQYPPQQYPQQQWYQQPPKEPPHIIKPPHRYRGWILTALVLGYLASLVFLCTELVAVATVPTPTESSSSGILSVLSTILIILIYCFIFVLDRRNVLSLFGRIHWKQLNGWKRVGLVFLYLCVFIIPALYLYFATQYFLRVRQQTLGGAFSGVWSSYRAKSGTAQLGIALATTIVLISFVGLTGVFAVIDRENPLTVSQTPTNSTPTEQATQASQAITAIAQDNQTPTAIQVTPTPVPTVSAAELEVVYKASTTNTTIATLDKDGNADNSKDVHFTCTIMNFVKDSNGNTAGANVDDPNTSGVVQIAFPANTDLSRLNTGDILEVWGTDGGTQSGQNAFGATIQEVVVSANYMTDKTTNYQANG